MNLDYFDGYVEKVEGYTFDLNLLCNEYKEVIEPNLFQPVNNHYQEVKCIWENKTFDILNRCIETQKAIEVVSKFFVFNTVVWRQLNSQRAYHWHMDECKLNYHIPIYTNAGCWFVYPNKSFHLSADGSIYKVNNHRYHTFVNAGYKPRVHLIFENHGTDIIKERMTQITKDFFIKKKHDTNKN